MHSTYFAINQPMKRKKNTNEKKTQQQQLCSSSTSRQFTVAKRFIQASFKLLLEEIELKYDASGVNY